MSEAKNFAVVDAATLVVDNVILAKDGFAIDGKVLVASDTAGGGDVYDEATGEFTRPEVPEPILSVDELKALAASLRWRKETGGITVGGSPIDTSRESQAMINGAYNLAMDDPDALIRFKSPAGFVTLDSATMIAIGREVGRHVQACFALEADVVDAIEAGAVTTAAQVDAGFA